MRLTRGGRGGESLSFVGSSDDFGGEFATSVGALCVVDGWIVISDSSGVSFGSNPTRRK